MDIFDIEALLVVDYKGSLLIKKVFNQNVEKMNRIIFKCVTEKDPLFLFENSLVFCCKVDELCTIMVCNVNSNEIMLGYSFDQLNIAIKYIVKKFNKETVYKKYDLLNLLFDSFVYQGIISENKSENLISKLPKRSFEGVEGIKVQKGFASVINNASKSLSRFI
ncbi:golgi-to-er vesicle coat component [Vairimorpha apis BRL 01]|uniref:Golgi-to-er vesicle coat component n=1 Tax=Vairimorpha apis BRL 01 TaxID=1037528 RepID=T0KZZ8_9MICR|nr:golgi-to-er vesicle coat component [Vairimorpha apis BRL 01]